VIEYIDHLLCAVCGWRQSKEDAAFREMVRLTEELGFYEDDRREHEEKESDGSGTG
jgi:hypothetical protein